MSFASNAKSQMELEKRKTILYFIYGISKRRRASRPLNRHYNKQSSSFYRVSQEVLLAYKFVIGIIFVNIQLYGLKLLYVIICLEVVISIIQSALQNFTAASFHVSFDDKKLGSPTSVTLQHENSNASAINLQNFPIILT